MKYPGEESQGENTGRWTTRESELFKEAIRLYGRNWVKVAMHVKTRNSVQVRSHAQKYF